MPFIDHFGLLAPIYEKVIPPPINTDWEMLLRLPFDGKLLDVGSGTGRIAKLLTRVGVSVISLDESQKMLKMAAGHIGISPACGSAERLPFSDATFKRILMVDVFHHLQNQPVAASELWRVLAPGGRIVIEEPDIRHRAVQWIALGEKLLLMRSHFWKPEQIAECFSNQAKNIEIKVFDGTAWILVDK